MSPLGSVTIIPLRLLELYNIEAPELKLRIHKAVKNGRIDSCDFDKLWQEISELIDDPCFALKAAQIMQPTDIGIIGFYWLVAPNLYAALSKIKQYSSIISEGITVEFIENETELTYVMRYPDNIALNPARVDSAFSVLIELCRVNYGPNFEIKSARFVHSVLKEKIIEYENFFKAPVFFNQSVDSIVFNKKILLEPLLNFNKELAAFNNNLLEKTVLTKNKESISTKVEVIILEHLSTGQVSEETIANLLAVSVRTLRRQLSDEKTSFKFILNNLRESSAKDYILSGKFSITEISFMLGYNEVSSFSRAFKRWTGTSPLKYAS